MGKADPMSGNQVVAGALEAGPRRNLASPMRDVPPPILVSSENTLKILYVSYRHTFYILFILINYFIYFILRQEEFSPRDHRLKETKNFLDN